MVKAETEEPPAASAPPLEVQIEEEEAATTAPSPSLQRQLHQIAGGQNLSTGLGGQAMINPLSSDMSKFQRSINEGDFEFLKYLTFDDLTLRMSGNYTV